MPRRAAIVTQADITRAIRAVLAEELTVYGVFMRADGVEIVTRPLAPAEGEPWDERRDTRAPRGAEIIT